MITFKPIKDPQLRWRLVTAPEIRTNPTRRKRRKPMAIGRMGNSTGTEDR